MKFCSKCGNQLQDDMAFCPKCGAQFFDNTTTEVSEVEEKLSKLKSYSLGVDPDVITWDYCRNVSGTELGQMMVHQDKFREEMTELISQILDELDEHPNPIVEHELYMFVFNMAIEMIKSSTKMFSDYSGFQELFNQGHILCQKGLISPQNFLNDMIQTDSVYKQVTGLQMLQASMLKAALHSSTIKQSQEYTTKAKILAENYMNCFKADMRRYTDHYAHPSEQYLLNSQWDIYKNIMAGLDYEYVKWIEKSIWESAKKDQSQSTIDSINRKRKAFLEELKKQEIKDYLMNNPEIKEELENLYSELDIVKKQLKKAEDDEKELKNRIDSFSDAVKKHEENISSNCQKIERLKKRIFGKQNAESARDELEKENEEERNKIDEIEAKKSAMQEKLYDMIDDLTELKAQKNTIINKIKEINPYY